MDPRRRLVRIEERAAEPVAVPVRLAFWMPAKQLPPELAAEDNGVRFGPRPGVYPVEGVPGTVVVHYDPDRPELLPEPYRSQLIARLPEYRAADARMRAPRD